MNELSFEELLESYGPLAGIEENTFSAKGRTFIRYRFGRRPRLSGYLISKVEAERLLREAYEEQR